MSTGKEAMTTEDYKIVAGALNSVLLALLAEQHGDEVAADEAAAVWVVHRCAERIAQRLRDDNPHFDERLFLAAVRA